MNNVKASGARGRSEKGFVRAYVGAAVGLNVPPPSAAASTPARIVASCRLTECSRLVRQRCLSIRDQTFVDLSLSLNKPKVSLALAYKLTQPKPTHPKPS
jgi:hypothetical protein